MKNESQKRDHHEKNGTGGIVEINSPHPWPSGLKSLSLGQRPGMEMPTHRWPNGPLSLSPEHRPGTETSVIRRPEGPRFGFAWFRVPPYRAPLARGNSTDGYPGRRHGIKNWAPLLRKNLKLTTGNVLYSKLRPHSNKAVCPDSLGTVATKLVSLRPNPKKLDRQYRFPT